MAKDFEKYNHLNYKDQDVDATDQFIDFLYQNSEIEAPDVDIDAAWNSLSGQINNKKSGFNWMKIAASVSLVVAVSIALYITNFSPEQIFVASADQKVNVTFPDGSIGVLNENSSFTYLEKFGDERRVSFEGEAYFDIKKSQKPFVIDVNGVEVKVLGTAFNLVSKEESVTLFVDRGLVAFAKDGNETKVKAGLEAVFNKKTNEVTISETPSENIMSWRNGFFKFDDTPLSDALVDLGEYYDVDFKLGNDKLSTCRISATFENKSLGEVLELIESILNVRTNLKDQTVKISGRGC